LDILQVKHWIGVPDFPRVEVYAVYLFTVVVIFIHYHRRCAQQLHVA